MTLTLRVLLILFVPLVLGFTVWTRNQFLWDNYCHMNFDLGIFIEIFKKNLNGEWNPFIEVRQIKQFNDHFTPIFNILSIKTEAFGLSRDALIQSAHHVLWALEIGFLAVLSLFLLYEVVRKKLSLDIALLGAAFFFLNRDIFEALFFPVHPATWGGALLVMIGWSSFQIYSAERSATAKYHFSLFVFYTVLITLDEQFAFVGFSLGLAFIFMTKDRLRGLLWVFYGLFMIWLTSSGRRLVFGPLMPYYDLRVATNLEQWLQHFDFTLSSIKSFALHTIALLPIGYLFFTQKKSLGQKLKSLLFLFIVFSPLLVGRLLTASFGLHYGVAIVSFWTAILISLFKDTKLKPAVLYACLIFLASLSVSKHKKTIMAQTHLTNLNCVRRDVPLQAFQTRTQLLNEFFEQNKALLQSERIRILASANLGPNLMTFFPKARIFQLGEYKITSNGVFDIIILERGQFGENIYAQPQTIEAVIEKVKADAGTKILAESDSLFAAEVALKYQDIDQYYREQPRHK